MRFIPPSAADHLHNMHDHLNTACHKKKLYMRDLEKNLHRCRACRLQKVHCGNGDEQEVHSVDVHVGGRRVLGHQGNHGRGRCRSPIRSWPTRTVRRKSARERCERSKLEMIVAVPWRKNDDDEKIDGERLKGEVVLMETDYKVKLEMEEHVPVSQRVHTSRDDLKTCGFSARCSRCLSMLSGAARQAHTVNCRKRILRELTGTAKAGAVQRRETEYEDRAVERGAKRRKSSPEETRTDRGRMGRARNG